MQDEISTRKSPLLWIIPLICFLLFIPFSAYLDVAISSLFTAPDGRFHASAWCWKFYRLGLRPGQALFLLSSATCVLTFCLRKKALYIPALYLSLTLCLGSGLIGHGLLKHYWQRPRPKQTVLFGSNYPFCPMYKPYVGPVDRHLRSLPSGHATMGFYFFSLYFLGRRLRRRSLKILGLTLAVLLGGTLSWLRICQGGHFISDIVTSALIMWQSAYWLDHLLLEEKPVQADER